MRNLNSLAQEDCQQVLGDYELLNKLDSGGMDAVHRAPQTAIGLQCVHEHAEARKGKERRQAIGSTAIAPTVGVDVMGRDGTMPV